MVSSRNIDGITTMRWIRPNVRGVKPSPRYFHSMAAMGDAVIVIGGKDDNTRFTDVHVFNKDMRSCQWAQPQLKGQPPKPRSAHTVSVVETKIYVFGGHRDGEKFNDTHILDTASMSWVCPQVKGIPPGKRNAHTTTVVGTSLYVFGGFDGESCNDLHIFETLQYKWSQPVVSGDIPSRRCCHTVINIGKQLWLFAGKNNDSGGVIDRFNDVHSYDIPTRTWTNLAPRTTGCAPTKRNAHVACPYMQYMLVFAGFDGDSCSDLFMFNTENYHWNEIMCDSLHPRPRYCHSAVTYPTGGGNWAMLSFGGCDSDHNYADIQILEISQQTPAKDQQRRIAQLEDDKTRLEMQLEEQKEVISKLKIDLSTSKQGDENAAENSDDDEEISGRKKKKKKKDKKKRRAKSEEAFQDEEHDTSPTVQTSRMPTQPKPPAHLAPLNTARVPRTSVTDGNLISSCPARLTTIPSKSSLFPPLKG